jgi:hypothetical protein
VLGAVTYEYGAQAGDGLAQLQGDALKLCTLLIHEDEWVMSWADCGIDSARAALARSPDKASLLEPAQALILTLQELLYAAGCGSPFRWSGEERFDLLFALERDFVDSLAHGEPDKAAKCHELLRGSAVAHDVASLRGMLGPRNAPQLSGAAERIRSFVDAQRAQRQRATADLKRAVRPQHEVQQHVQAAWHADSSTRGRDQEVNRRFLAAFRELRDNLFRTQLMLERARPDAKLRVRDPRAVPAAPASAAGTALARQPTTGAARAACAACGAAAANICGGCRAVAFCTVACQRSHWRVHKLECRNKKQ